jgi:hypothetical protein
MLDSKLNGIDERQLKLTFLSVVRRRRGLCMRRTAHDTISE